MIASDSDLCGIAAYTRSLEKQLDDVFEVSVFDLDRENHCEIWLKSAQLRANRCRLMALKR